MDDLFGASPPLDVEAFLRGDLQGRDRCISGDDHHAVEAYLKEWQLPYEDYQRRREVLDSRQYSYFGSCPECECEGAVYSLPYPYGKVDWLVCSGGCKTRWCFGFGHFRAYTPDDMPETEQEAVLEKLEGYKEVEPLIGWKLDLLEGLDVGVRLLPVEDISECALCGFAAIPDPLRKLVRFVFFGIHGAGVPLLSLNRQAPLCMVCGGEFSYPLQAAVNDMWGLDHPTGIGKAISAPHADQDDDLAF